MSAVEILTQLASLLTNLSYDDYVRAINDFDVLVEKSYDNKAEFIATIEILQNDIKSLTQHEN